MKHFVYYSKRAQTSGNFNTNKLMQAGRMDIACQIVIMSFFVSHQLRNDVTLHLVFDGGPDPTKHLELCPGKNVLVESENKIDISKKDVGGLIKKMLYKYQKGKKIEISPGYFIEKKGFIKVVEELMEKDLDCFVLDKKGENLREAKIEKDCVFILGDQDGIPKSMMKNLKKLGVEKISVGPKMYFASQVVTILHNELDYREI